MKASHQLKGFRNAALVYTVVGICIAGSLVFLPLITSVSIIFLAAYWLLFAQKKFSLSSTKAKLAILFCALYLPVVIGTFYSADTGEAFTQLQLKLPLLALPVLFGCSDILTINIRNKILKSFVVFTLLGCMVCITAALITFIWSGTVHQLHGYELVILKQMPPFVFGFFCLLSLIFILNELDRGALTQRSYKIISLLLVVVFSVFLFLLGNRNILLCWIIVMLFFGFRLVPTASTRILFLCVLIAMLVAAILLNPSLRKQWNDLADFSDNNAISLDADKSLGRAWGGKAIRVAIWRCSEDVIKKNWLTGVGTGDVQHALQQAYEDRQFYFAARYNQYNAHNQYIQETIAFGIAGLCIFLACLFVPAILYVRLPEYRVYILFLICFSIICLTESTLEISKGVTMYAFFNALFAFTGKPAK